MEIQSDVNGEMAIVKEKRQQLESRVDALHNVQLDFIASLQTLVPDIVSSLDLSLKVVSAFSGRPFTPLPTPNPNPNRRRPKLPPPPPSENHTNATENRSLRRSAERRAANSKNQQPEPAPEISICRSDGEKFTIDESGSPLSVVRSMVAVCLLEMVPFAPIDSSTVLLRLENDQSAMAAEKAALRELGGESGAILAVEMALRSMEEDNGGVDLEEFVVSGKSRVMVVGIDRSRLVKELPESQHHQQNGSNSSSQGNQIQPASGGEVSDGVFRMGGPIPRPMSDIWRGSVDPHFSGFPPLFPGIRAASPMMGPRDMGGMMVMPRGMGVSTIHSGIHPIRTNAPMGGSNLSLLKPRTEEDDLKDLEALLNKKSFRESQKSRTGEELLDLICRPTAKETAVAAKVVEFISFKSC